MIHSAKYWGQSSIYILCFFLLAFGLKAQNSLQSQFQQFEIHEIESSSITKTLASTKSITKKLKLLGFDLELIESDIIDLDYQSITSTGKVTKKEDLATPYQGYTAQGGRVSMTIGTDFIFGFIEDGAETIYIEPLSYFVKTATKGQFISYKASDVKQGSPKTCGVTEVSKIKEQSKTLIADQCYDVQYAICNDYTIFQKYGSSIVDVENRAIGIVNNVNTDYDDAFADQLNFVIPGQYTVDCAGCDPWSSSTNPGTLLTSFANWAKNNLDIPHDVSSLWSDRNFDGSTIGLAYVGTVCNFNFRYNILEDFSTNASLTRVLCSHELGHNFGASHVDGTTTFIMSPSVNGSTTWNSNSIASIESYYNNVNCLSTCVPDGTIPTISFNSAASIVTEKSTTGSTTSCNLNYISLNINIALSNQPTAPVTANIIVDGVSTATVGYDFQLLTPSVTFEAGQSLTKTVEVLIHEDHIEEFEENIQLSYQIVTGSVNDGDNTTHTITIEDPNDFASEFCCSGGTSTTYGNYNYNAGMIFYGSYQDNRTRTLILASELAEAGLVAGEFDAMSLFVSEKNSSGPFKEFRIGLAEVSNSTLQNMSWISTTEVFQGDYNSKIGENEFQFTNAFTWDGTSNLYIQFCFNNTSTSGTDVLQSTTPLVSTSNLMTQFQRNNNADGCNDIGTNTTYFFSVPIQPQIKFINSFGALAATTVSSASSTIRSGETANLYNSEDRLILSIDNSGATDIDCLAGQVFTNGTSKLNANFGDGDYTSKTYYIEGDNPSNYQLSLYYTNNELATWGSNISNLNLVRSSTPLSSATENDVEIISPSEIVTDHLGNAQVLFRGNFTDFGYFGLTDITPEIATGNIENSDLVIGQSNRGLLLKSPNGTKYRIYSNGSSLSTLATSGDTKACMAIGDLFVTSSSNKVLLKQPGSGYTRINISNSGSLSFSSTNSLPNNKIVLQSGDFEVEEVGKGLILKSADGTCWKVSVSNTGAIETYSLGICP